MHTSRTLRPVQARMVITAVEIEGRSVIEVTQAYGVSRFWVYEDR